MMAKRLLIFLLLSNSLFSQEFGMSPLMYELTDEDSLQFPITHEIEIAIKEIRDLDVKSDYYYTKFDFAFFSKYDSIYVSKLNDTIPIFPNYEIELIYPESDFTYTYLPQYAGQAYKNTDSIYFQYTSEFEGILPHKWNLRDYPFDTQQLKVVFVSEVDTSQLLIKPSEVFKSKIYYDNVNYLMDGYELLDITVEENFITSPYVEEYSDGVRNNVNHELTFNINIDRKGSFLFFKLFFGGVLSYIISILVFFIDRKYFESRITLSIGGIFGGVGNKYFVENNLPDIQVLTKADILNNFIIIFIIINIFIVIAQSNKKINIGILEKNGKAFMISTFLFIISNLIIILL